MYVMLVQLTHNRNPICSCHRLPLLSAAHQVGGSLGLAMYVVHRPDVNVAFCFRSR